MMSATAMKIVYPDGSDHYLQGKPKKPKKGVNPAFLKGEEKARASAPKTVVGACPNGEPKAVREVWKKITPQLKDILHVSDRTIVLEICRLIVERDVDYQRIHTERRSPNTPVSYTHLTLPTKRIV